jgi:hypothetical protein
MLEPEIRLDEATTAAAAVAGPKMKDDIMDQGAAAALGIHSDT